MLTDRLTDEAIHLIENNDGAPFFLNLWYYTVHTPIQDKQETITIAPTKPSSQLKVSTHEAK
jgi:hypothetical protein